MEQDDPYNPSFTPNLPHDPLREKVPSSGYGTHTAKHAKKEVDRSWEVGYLMMSIAVLTA
jgi:hypothetical protein